MLFRLIVILSGLLFSVANASAADNEPMPLVSALKKLNIKTINSCAGHLQPEVGQTYPWVTLDLRTDKTKDLQEKILTLVGKMMASEEVGFEGLKPLRLLQKEYSQALAEAQQPLRQLLVEFYNIHPVSYDRMLMLTEQGPAIEVDSQKAQVKGEHYILHNQGAPFQTFRSTEERAEKLHEYQMEMLFFAQFLVNRIAGKQ